MASDDYLQISTIIHRLDQLVGLVDPFDPSNIVETVVNAISVTVRQIPGDPGELRTLAQAYHQAGDDSFPLSQAVTILAAQGLPEIWQGEAADTAQGVMFSMGDLLSRTKPAFTDVAAALDGYADTLERLQKRHSELQHGLNRLYYIADWIVFAVVTVVAVGAIFAGLAVGQLIEILLLWAAAFYLLVGHFVANYNECLAAADMLEVRFADAQAKAATAGAVKSGMAPVAAVGFADSTIAAKGLDKGSTILSAGQLSRAAQLRAALSPQDRSALDAAIAAAKSPLEQAYILKALVAGHSVTEVTRFAATIRAKGAAWLQQHLSLVDPSQPDTVVGFAGKALRQQDHDSCGPMTVVVARTMSDPLYALSLTTDGNGNDLSGDAFSAKLAVEEQRVGDATHAVWPKGWGTTPEGLATGMNQHAGALGTQYTSHWVDDTDPRSVDAALRDAVSAVDAGHPVPVLVTPALNHVTSGAFHYLLLVGHHDGKLTFYDPTGPIIEVSDSAFRNGTMTIPGTELAPHVEAVVLPTS